MNLFIITPHETKSYDAAWLEINTPHGNMIVQRGHVPMIITLIPHQPVIFRLKNGRQESIVPRLGIVEISRNAASVIVNDIRE